jgi:hypothetical protein
MPRSQFAKTSRKVQSLRQYLKDFFFNAPVDRLKAETPALWPNSGEPPYLNSSNSFSFVRAAASIFAM